MRVIAVCAIAIVTALVCVLIVPGRSSQRRAQSLAIGKSIDLGVAHLLGNPGAPVVVAEFADFRCTFCERFARETLPALKRQYVDSGRVLLAFVHWPSPTRPTAIRAAEAAVCAANHGRFWDVHDVFYRRRAELSSAVIDDVLRDLGLPADGPGGTIACMDGRTRPVVADHAALAHQAEIVGTPEFLVGYRGLGLTLQVTTTVSGAKPLSEFQAAIDQLLIPR